MAAKKQPMLKTMAEFESALRELRRVEVWIDAIEAQYLDETSTWRELIGTKRDAADARVKAEEAARKELVGQIAAYFFAHRGELLDGDRRSVDVADARVGLRTTPPAVQIDGDEQAVIAELERRRLERFIRRTPTVNREAMLADREAAERVPGVSIVQGDQFYVELADTAIRLIKGPRSVKRESTKEPEKGKPRKSA